MSNKPIQLSKEETEEINKMMQENQKQSKPSTKPTKKQAEAQKEIDKAYKAMKKLLKLRSKGELIDLVWTYGVQLQEMQRVAQMLLEENKELKGEDNAE